MFYILKMDHSKILGVVLAGGKSLRFGEDKSQVKLNNKSLIDHILSEILTEFKELLIVSNNSIAFNKSENISIISDFKNNLGPLGGVLTAMKWIKDNNKDYQWISTFPTDTPFFKNKILKDLIEKILLKNLKNGRQLEIFHFDLKLMPHRQLHLLWQHQLQHPTNKIYFPCILQLFQMPHMQKP